MTGHEVRPRLAVAASGEAGGPLPRGTYTSTQDQIAKRYRELVAAGRIPPSGLGGFARRRAA